jgi:hypothetical protein
MDKEEKGLRGEEVDVGAEEEELDENDPHGDGYGGKGDELGISATRTSTKSSWKDPGPPPDGGWKGWTQGELPVSWLVVDWRIRSVLRVELRIDRGELTQRSSEGGIEVHTAYPMKCHLKCHDTPCLVFTFCFIYWHEESHVLTMASCS